MISLMHDISSVSFCHPEMTFIIYILGTAANIANVMSSTFTANHGAASRHKKMSYKYSSFLVSPKTYPLFRLSQIPI